MSEYQAIFGSLNKPRVSWRPISVPDTGRKGVKGDGIHQPHPWDSGQKPPEIYMVTDRILLDISGDEW